MASKRRNMFHKNKTQETTEKDVGPVTCSRSDASATLDRHKSECHPPMGGFFHHESNQRNRFERIKSMESIEENHIKGINSRESKGVSTLENLPPWLSGTCRWPSVRLKMSFFISSKSITVVALGLGFVIGAVGYLVHDLYFAKKRRLLQTTEALSTQTESEAESSQPNASSSFNGEQKSNSYSDVDIDRDMSSDSLVEYYSLSDEESFSLADDREYSTVNRFNEIDRLLDSEATDVKMAYDTLLDFCYEDKNDPEVFWRVAKACHILAIEFESKENITEMEKYINKEPAGGPPLFHLGGGAEGTAQSEVLPGGLLSLDNSGATHLTTDDPSPDFGGHPVTEEIALSEDPDTLAQEQQTDPELPTIRVNPQLQLKSLTVPSTNYSLVFETATEIASHTYIPKVKWPHFTEFTTPVILEYGPHQGS
ncbi:hypothetical protein AAG570_006743 [Ranatra chinensis]|uniref:Uncharacterized protein n=1 Tax=Ranatra chinensis TaxID=642074 RepID=A0ABD0YUZ9_9HEMI